MLQPKIRISSSISNFHEKLLKRTGLTEWRWNIFTPTIFVGMYHWGDYIRAILHFSKKKIFWCGSDILNLTPFRARFVKRGKHYCENVVEQKRLGTFGIKAEICPMIFTDFPTENSFIPNKNLHVWMTVHKGREEEYGVNIVRRIAPYMQGIFFHIYGIDGKSKGNIIYHGQVPDGQFNKEITRYHAALRLNEFDGFAEILAKSVLLGQYPISRIPYPGIDTYSTIAELVIKLSEIKNKKTHNLERLIWYARLEQNLNHVIGDWNESHRRDGSMERFTRNES